MVNIVFGCPLGQKTVFLTLGQKTLFLTLGQKTLFLALGQKTLFLTLGQQILKDLSNLPLNSSPLCIIWLWYSSELLASPARTDGGPDREHSGLMFNTVGADSGRKLPGRPRENRSLDSSSSSPCRLVAATLPLYSPC